MKKSTILVSVSAVILLSVFAALSMNRYAYVGAYGYVVGKLHDGDGEYYLAVKNKHGVNLVQVSQSQYFIHRTGDWYEA